MSKTILAVDDSASVRQLVRMTLTGAGYQVIEAGDGREALTKAQSSGGPIHGVVTDVNMPHMNGIELVAELRKLPSFDGVPILCLTTESDEGMKQQARSAGASGWLIKPFRPEQLVSVVNRITGA